MDKKQSWLKEKQLWHHSFPAFQPDCHGAQEKGYESRCSGKSRREPGCSPYNPAAQRDWLWCLIHEISMPPFWPSQKQITIYKCTSWAKYCASIVANFPTLSTLYYNVLQSQPLKYPNDPIAINKNFKLSTVMLINENFTIKPSLTKLKNSTDLAKM